MDAISFSYRKPLSVIPSLDSFLEKGSDEDPSKTSINQGTVGAHDGAPIGYPGSIGAPLVEDPEVKKEREEQELFNKKIEDTVALIKAIDGKFKEIQRQSDEINKDTFYIRFDTSLYPGVAESVSFYTDGISENYISWDTYKKAKQELRSIYDEQLKEVRDSSQTTSTTKPGISSVLSQKKKKKKKTVIRLAFEAILSELVKWFYSIPVVKAASSFFRSSRASTRKLEQKEMLDALGIPNDIREIDGELINFESLKTDDAKSERAITLLDYVIDCVKGDEQYISANIPFPELILMDEMLLPMEEEFYLATELTSPFISDPEVRAIGANSATHNPDSMPYARQSILLSRAIRPVFQESFLQNLDGNLARILRILQGWYLDPRTYCCLINIMGGISRVTPKWLYALRFNLKYSIALLDLEHMTIRDSMKNILNLIVQSIVGGIIMHLHSFARGYLSKKEHELLASILDSSSKFARCAPYDVLVQEFKVQADAMVNQLAALANNLTSKLMFSVKRFETGIGICEKRLALRQTVDLLDIFINTWEVGYICGNDGFNESGLDSREEDRKPIISSLKDLSEAEQRELLVSTGTLTKDMKAPVSKDEMTTFLKNNLGLNDNVVSKVSRIYDNPTELAACIAGFTDNQISSYKAETQRILSGSR